MASDLVRAATDMDVQHSGSLPLGSVVEVGLGGGPVRMTEDQTAAVRGKRQLAFDRRCTEIRAWEARRGGSNMGIGDVPAESLAVEGDALMDDSTGDAITQAGAPVDTDAGRAAPIAQAAEAVTPVSLPTAPRNPAISPASSPAAQPASEFLRPAGRLVAPVRGNRPL